MRVEFDDGGRAAGGFDGRARGCVTRSIAIAAGLLYRDVYEALSAGCRAQRVTKRTRWRSSARSGVNTNRQWFREYLAALGFRRVPTMHIGSGCQVHLAEGELPTGRLIVALSKHYTAVIDGVIHDTHDPQREVHQLTPNRGHALKPGEWVNANGVWSIRRRYVCTAIGLEWTNRVLVSTLEGDMRMWRSSVQQWSKTRERGMRPWVLRRGVLGWGLPMYIAMSALQIGQTPQNWRHIALIGLPVWLGAGVAWGALTWATMEWWYRRRLRKTGGS